MEEFEAQLAAIQTKLPAVDIGQESGASASDAKKAGRGRAIGEALGLVLTKEQQKSRALLMAEAKHLDSEAEIKRIFGSFALKDSAKGKVPQSRLPKRLTLSHPKLSWPPMRASPGVEMELLEREKADEELGRIMDEDCTGGMWFALTHSPRFQSIQLEFLGSVMTHNPDAIAALVYQHPYHVDALLQLSEIIKQTSGDFGEAAELVERALYAFECGFATKFSATNGIARLDFRRVESRSFFLALFRHMQFMARRGCWRTVFEFNKVLLSLDPQHDPYGVLLTLDFHALKCKQYEYVRAFVRDWAWSSVDLPNWAYSSALAEFMLERSKSSAGSKSAGRGAESRSLELLVRAILTFPTVVPPLWSKANIDIDPVILTHPYFQDEQIPDESAMTHMQLIVQLFVERNYPLYRTPEALRWLQEGLLLALERIARADADNAGGSADEDIARKDANKKRLCTYVIPENISRHVLVADMEALKAGLPEEIRSAESFAFDPLPPASDINVYDELLGSGQLGRAHESMPGAFELDGELIDVGGMGEEGVAFIQRMIDQIRHRFGGARRGEEDPGTSEDDEEYVEAGDDEDGSEPDYPGEDGPGRH
ncbi:DUF654-domain-containing protein [Martensiomyces pterosporus]|nr:DUF654-domain-containing protein [Martensiomyces pterosporus]